MHSCAGLFIYVQGIRKLVTFVAYFSPSYLDLGFEWFIWYLHSFWHNVIIGFTTLLVNKTSGLFASALQMVHCLKLVRDMRANVHTFIPDILVVKSPPNAWIAPHIRVNEGG